ncbi:hypothetical protein N8I77_009964 [Diaporthe amygdali]|uniref:Uncharacterized protein n=1 Tax=Phomopsis amygdali TaxID=1214568 RepID=A0AAD9VYN0_PHOAM|nr:hypothetical protein N8I77_009964 [Diaporthe amygdali]
MPFNFSFSSSATFVSTSSVNGRTSGQAYQRQSYSTPQGSGVRTTHQKLGEAPVTNTRLYDAQGRELIGDGSGYDQNHGNQAYAPSRRIISIEDVTEEEADKAARQNGKQNGP